MSDKPSIIDGGLAVDERGQISFVNKFNPFLSEIKRFYMVSNHKRGFIRAWHAHRYEGKYVLALKGSALVGAVKIDNFDNPARGGEVTRVVLSDKKPEVFYIPEGFAYGFMSLTEDAQLMFFSPRTLEESEGDDYRYDYRHWNIWGDNYR